MTKKMLCAVDDTEHAKIGSRRGRRTRESYGCGTHSSCCELPMGGPGGGIMVYAWDDADLKRVLDSATAIAKKAGVLAPKTAGVKSRDTARSIVVFADRTTTLITLSSERVAKAGWPGWCWFPFQATLSLVPIAL